MYLVDVLCDCHCAIVSQSMACERRLYHLGLRAKSSLCPKSTTEKTVPQCYCLFNTPTNERKDKDTSGSKAA